MTTPTSSVELSGSMTVNQVVERVPAALTVFSRHGIDTCCGGNLPVETAAERHDVAADALLDEIQRAAASD